MKVTRQELIDLCDNFLNDKIDKVAIQDFAWTAITDDNFEWQDDEIISDTIFEWDNEDINFEINRTNISLWKKRLLTDKDDLLEHNFWNSHIDKDPINGLRHPAENGTTGWFIWTGDYSETDDFFQPMCAEHLLQQRPEIIKYLGLDIGFRFLADRKDYEDIWFDEKLKNI